MASFSFNRIFFRGTITKFWKSIGREIRVRDLVSPTTPIESRETFLHAFRTENWDLKVVLLLDDLSELLSAPEDIRGDFLQALKETKMNAKDYAIKSVIGTGHSDSITSFDIVNNTYFTAEGTRKLFNEYAEDNWITIDDSPDQI
jgi:hypothetical protein